MNAIGYEAEALYKQGYSPVPLAPREKYPTTKGWQSKTFGPADFRPDGNIGVKLGGPSNGLIDIDLDDPIALELADQYLPKTDAETGRDSTPRSHRWFICKGIDKIRRFQIPDHGTILEIRSTGGQTVVGPSIHPSGEKYSCLRGKPARYSVEELTNACESLYRAVCERYEVEPKQTEPPAQKPPVGDIADVMATKPTRAGQEGGDIESRVIAYLNHCPPAISKQGGHGQTFQVVQSLVNGFELDNETAFRLFIQHYNPRCEPPWSDSEIRHKIESARQSPCNKPRGWLLQEGVLQESVASEESVRALIAEAKRKNGKAELPAETIDKTLALGADYLEADPPPPEAIIPERIDRGDKFYLIGPSKARKSFAALQLALALASGRPFLNWPASKQSRVLVIQFELKAGNYARRTRYVAGALGVTAKDIGDRLVIANMRGKAFALDKLNVSTFDVVIIDPQYKLFAHEGADENKSVDVARVLGMIDRIIETQGPAFVVVHHVPKGRPGDRSAIDRGSGSGVQSRDFDGLATITPHRDHSNEWLVLDVVLRNYRSPESVTIEFQDGRFVVRDDVPPEVETSRSAADRRQKGPPCEDMATRAAQWVREWAKQEGKPMPTANLKDKIRDAFSVGRGAIDRVVRQLETDGFVRGKASEFPAYSIIEPPHTDQTDQTDRQPSLSGL